MNKKQIIKELGHKMRYGYHGDLRCEKCERTMEHIEDNGGKCVKYPSPKPPLELN